MSQYKLKPSIKKKWLEALRNGGYIKTTRLLYRRRNNEDCFCAMGVLVNETVGFYPRKAANELGFYPIETANEYVTGATSDSASIPSDFLLPKMFRKGYVPKYWSHIKLKCQNKEVPIYTLNDSYKLSFNEMADLIEEQL